MSLPTEAKKCKAAAGVLFYCLLPWQNINKASNFKLFTQRKMNVSEEVV
jgi:hypothetical protein